MTTRPIDDPPTWATDANLPAGSDPWSGTPTRVAPSAGVAAAGAQPDDQLTAQIANHLWGIWSEWSAYHKAQLDGLLLRTWDAIDTTGTVQPIAVVYHPVGGRFFAFGINTATSPDQAVYTAWARDNAVFPDVTLDGAPGTNVERINDCVVRSTDGDVAIVGRSATAGTNVWISVDNGVTWNPVTLNSGIEILSVTESPTDNEFVYGFADGDIWHDATPATVPNANARGPFALGMLAGVATLVNVTPRNVGLDELVYSDDGGDTWAEASTGHTASPCGVAYIAKFDRWYVATINGEVRSSGDLATWVAETTIPIAGGADGLKAFRAFGDYLIGFDEDQQIWVSRDGGDTWNHVATHRGGDVALGADSISNGGVYVGSGQIVLVAGSASNRLAFTLDLTEIA